jgi:hypothetical protein
MANPVIAPGTKVGKLLAARMVGSEKTGNVAIEFSFSFMEGDKLVSLPSQMWVFQTDGSTNENTKKKIKEVLGWNGSSDIDEHKIFTDPKAFGYGKEYSLDVEIEENTDPATGKSYKNPKIKWVNALGGSGFSDIDVKKVKMAFEALGAKPPVKATAFTKPAGAAKPATKPAPAFNEDEELPI